MEPRLKWNKNVLAWVTYGGGSGLKFFKIILFQHGTTSEIKLAAKAISFHFRRGSLLKWNTKTFLNSLK